MMSIWDARREQEKKTKKALKSCTMAKQYAGCGFKEPVINGQGQCSGCRNPDDDRLENTCCTCEHNEYFVGEVTA